MNIAQNNDDCDFCHNQAVLAYSQGRAGKIRDEENASEQCLGERKKTME